MFAQQWRRSQCLARDWHTRRGKKTGHDRRESIRDGGARNASSRCEGATAVFPKRTCGSTSARSISSPRTCQSARCPAQDTHRDVAAGTPTLPSRKECADGPAAVACSKLLSRSAYAAFKAVRVRGWPKPRGLQGTPLVRGELPALSRLTPGITETGPRSGLLRGPVDCYGRLLA